MSKCIPPSCLSCRIFSVFPFYEILLLLDWCVGLFDSIFLFRIYCAAGEKSVARGLAVCLLRGVTNATAEDLKPVVAALSEAILEPLGEQAEAQKPAGGTEESSPSADLIAGADDDDGTDKRPDEQAAGGEVRLTSPFVAWKLSCFPIKSCAVDWNYFELLFSRRKAAHWGRTLFVCCQLECKHPHA